MSHYENRTEESIRIETAMIAGDRCDFDQIRQRELAKAAEREWAAYADFEDKVSIPAEKASELAYERHLEGWNRFDTDYREDVRNQVDG